jgi:hypothetical protein
MSRLPLAAVALLAFSMSAAPSDTPGADRHAADLPVGRWSVAFANGVTEVCDIGNGGEASVEEPRRRANGTAVVEGGSVVITFNDDRVERWTPVGRRFVVEHWYPASRLPTATPVLGIGERAE